MEHSPSTHAANPSNSFEDLKLINHSTAFSTDSTNNIDSAIEQNTVAQPLVIEINLSNLNSSVHLPSNGSKASLLETTRSDIERHETASLGLADTMTVRSRSLMNKSDQSFSMPINSQINGFFATDLSSVAFLSTASNASDRAFDNLDAHFHSALSVDGLTSESISPFDDSFQGIRDPFSTNHAYPISQLSSHPFSGGQCLSFSTPDSLSRPIPFASSPFSGPIQTIKSDPFSEFSAPFTADQSNKSNRQSTKAQLTHRATLITLIHSPSKQIHSIERDALHPLVNQQIHLIQRRLSFYRLNPFNSNAAQLFNENDNSSDIGRKALEIKKKKE
jgi:hypothetical protein